MQRRVVAESEQCERRIGQARLDAGGELARQLLDPIPRANRRRGVDQRVGVDMIGGDRAGGLIGGKCLVVPLHLLQQIGTIVERVGELRL